MLVWWSERVKGVINQMAFVSQQFVCVCVLRLVPASYIPPSAQHVSSQTSCCNNHWTLRSSEKLRMVTFTRFGCFFTERRSCPTQFFPAGGGSLPHKRNKHKQTNRNDPLSGSWVPCTSSTCTVSVGITLSSGAKHNTKMQKLQDFKLKHRFEANDESHQAAVGQSGDLWPYVFFSYFYPVSPHTRCDVCETPK